MKNNRNIKLCYCILGGTMLILFQSPMFQNALIPIFNKSEWLNLIILSMKLVLRILSFVGFILVLLCSILLIAGNININAE